MPRPDSINNITPYSMSFYLFLALIFVLIGRPQDVFPFLNPLSPALVISIISVIATLLSKRQLIVERLNNALLKKYILFYLIMIFGITFAYYRRQAFYFIFLYYIVNILFFIMFVVQVDSLQKLRKVFFIVVLCTIFYSTSTLTQGTYHHQRLFFGSVYDPNDLAYMLVSLFPLSLLFILTRERWFKKVICLLSIILSIMLILLTGSRGGFLALTITSLLLFFTPLVLKNRFARMVLLTFILTVAFSQKKHIPTERLMSLKNLQADYNISGEFGRYSIWKKAISITLSNPLTGVGVSCFPEAIGSLRESSSIQPRWQTAHNSYLLVAAETGVIGLLIFLSIILSSIKTFIYLSRPENVSDNVIEITMMCRILLLGFIGQLAASFFLSQSYSVIFTLFVAFAATLRNFIKTNKSDF